MMTSSFVLVTGGNRGLGQGLVKRFLEQANHTVIAAVRDPTKANSKALADLPKGDGSSLIVVKYDAAVEQDAFNLVKELQDKHKIDHLDIVIPNAGMVNSHPLVKDVKLQEIQEHIEVNAYGVVSLYQATRDLLQKSTSKPIFAPVGSGAGALGRQPPVPNASYGPSKTMVHWYGVRINVEDEWLNTFILDPGLTQTDMGNKAAHELLGIEEAYTTVDDCVDGMYGVITSATKEKHGGKIVLYTGEVQIW